MEVDRLVVVIIFVVILLIYIFSFLIVLRSNVLGWNIVLIVLFTIIHIFMLSILLISHLVCVSVFHSSGMCLHQGSISSFKFISNAKIVVSLLGRLLVLVMRVVSYLLLLLPLICPIWLIRLRCWLLLWTRRITTLSIKTMIINILIKQTYLLKLLI